MITEKRCVPCQGGVPPLKSKEINKLLIQLEEGWEVFSGPEILREEILDFLTILKLLMYKFAAQYSKLSQIIVTLPK